MTIYNTKASKFQKGFSLIEMLVVIFIFAILGVVLTQSLGLSIRGTQKSESIDLVKENLEYTANTMERLLRNAIDINDTSTNSNLLVYTDEYGEETRFECDSATTYVASGSAELRLTSDEVEIDCAAGIFNYTPPLPGSNVPKSVDIILTGRSATFGEGVEGSVVTVRTKILLRNYTID